jgi:hypothetical protein
VGAFFGALHAPNYGYQTAHPAYRNAQTELDSPSQVDRNRSGLPQFAERLAFGPDPQNSGGRENRDLAAQESMTVWAFWMLLVSAIGTATTMVGTGLLLWQIILTRKAVEDTGEATKAMREANRLARLAAEMDLRAWIGITAKLKDCEMGSTGFSMGLEVTLENFGRTPAPETWVGIRMFGRTGLGVDCALDDDEFSDQPYGPIFPNESHSETFQMVFSDKQIEELTSLTREQESVATIVFELQVDYSTMFDEPDYAKRTSRIGYSVVYLIPIRRPKCIATGSTIAVESKT